MFIILRKCEHSFSCFCLWVHTPHRFAGCAFFHKIRIRFTAYDVSITERSVSEMKRSFRMFISLTVLLIGKTDTSVDSVSGASTRDAQDAKSVILH